MATTISHQAPAPATSAEHHAAAEGKAGDYHDRESSPLTELRAKWAPPLPRVLLSAAVDVRSMTRSPSEELLSDPDHDAEELLMMCPPLSALKTWGAHLYLSCAPPLLLM
eukprot:1175608-Prorocentrum_minimum.AAC.3